MSKDPAFSIDSQTGSEAVTEKNRAAGEALLDAMKRLDALQTQEASQRGAEGAGSSGPQAITPEEHALMTQLCDALGQMDLRSAWGIEPPGAEPALGGTQGLAFAGADSFLPGLGVPAEIAGVEENGNQDMGLFDKHRICICSEVEGVITKDGQPLVGAEVVRRLDLFLPKDRVYTDTTTTNSSGRFSFDPAYAKKWNHRLGEVRTEQKILVRHEGETYLGWSNISSGRELHEDLHEVSAPEGFYFRLHFSGDIARATPLPERLEEERFVPEGQCFFNTRTVCVASLLRFTVTMNGEPAVGARVVRTAEYVGIGGFEQSKVADRDGEVELPAIYTPRLAHRDAAFEIRQRIVITHQGKDYLGWEKTKTNPWRFGEFNRDEDKWGYCVEIEAELSQDDTVVRGVVTDPNRRWSDDLPDGFIRYKGIFKVTRYK